MAPPKYLSASFFGAWAEKAPIYDFALWASRYSSFGSSLPFLQWDFNMTGWRAMTAFDIITEALLVGLSIRLVWGVQMRRTQKAGVIGAFGTRIVIVALTIVRQCYLNRVGLNNILLDMSNVVVATEVLLHSSLMAATVPCLKPFVIAFNTGWGQGGQKDGSYLRSETSEGPPSKARSRPYPADDEITMIPTGGARECEGYLEEASGGLMIHQTREWSLRTEYIEMQPLRGPERL
ncbi:similar to An03g00210 [Aspergillus luchuensis IFO 4308]|nr:similar to An03g00210 [Aspergillus luchuensis IFO 4308]